MKSKVLKYPIPFAENFTLDLPKGSKIVRIDVDQGNPYLWALVNIDEAEINTYHFSCGKTGGLIEHDNELLFIDTYAIFIQMELMLYVFLNKVSTPTGDIIASKFIEHVNNCWRG